MPGISPWTALYGLVGVICLWASIWRGDRSSVTYGGLMMLSWLGAAVACGVLSPIQAPFMIIVVDGVLALLTAFELRDRHTLRGEMILWLFFLEAAEHLGAATSGHWGDMAHFVSLNVTYLFQTLIAGGGSVVQTIRDWGRGRVSHARASRVGH